MSAIKDKFDRMATEHAPGQEVRQSTDAIKHLARGDVLSGTPVDFSHGDVNESAFAPTPGSTEAYLDGVRRGGEQAYTEYRGGAALREVLADRLGRFTGAPVSGANELIITPGTQGALFLAISATAAAGDKVAIVRPDYFANRKIVEFLGAEVVPVQMNYLEQDQGAGLDLGELEAAFRSGVKVFLFSNPNNPAGVVYSEAEIQKIAALGHQYGVTVIVDQLYSRLRYSGANYTHLRAVRGNLPNLITIMGPSKTESLSGYRLGVAFGSADIIDRMERLQAIVSLRAPGYSQAVLHTWFDEPEGWMDDRIARHQAIRDDLITTLRSVTGVAVRVPQAGSYLFPRLPALDVSLHEFVSLLRSQAGVTVTPGTEFSPHSTDSVRLNFSQNHQAAAHAVERMAQLIDRYRA